MVVRLIAVLLSAILILNSVLPARAQVQTYDLTDRGVFRLTASGAAKIALAESKIATAVRLLGMLGRVSSAVTVGFAAYEITSGLWDWWSRTYNQGAAGDLTMGAMTKGVQAGVGVGDCFAWRRQTYNGVETFYDLHSSCPSGVVFVGQTYSSSMYNDIFVQELMFHFINSSDLPLSPISDAVAGAAGREAFLSLLDSATAALQANSPEDVALASTFTSGSAYDGSEGVAGALAALAAARGVVSSGVGMGSDDVAVVNVGASVGALPGAIPGTGEGAEAGNSSLAAAIGAAIAAAAAAAASGYSSVVSAVQAVAAPIVAAISASQAAVVSAVQSVVTAITGVQTATESVGAKVDALGVKIDALAAPAVTPSQAPAVTCPACTRQDRWADAWSALSTAGQAAPVFGLINRIVINPTGTIQRVRAVSTANFGVLTFDLSAWGIDTYIGVVRYVVIFVALMAGYFVIFG